MIITNAQGNVLGHISHTAEEKTQRMISDARLTALEARTQEREIRRESYPLLAQARKARASVRRMTRRVGYGALAVVALGLVVSACSDDPQAQATSAQPALAPAPNYGELERTAPWSGSTLGDIRSGWQGVAVGSNGDVLINGHKVDNVLDTESPLRARYLDSFDANGLTRGIENTTVGEGIRFCSDLDNGSVVALREASDARLDAPAFNTSHRRTVLAAAAMVNFCPKFA